MTQRYYPGLQQTSNMKSFASILEDSEVLLHKCLWWVLDTPLLTLFERYYSLTLFIRSFIQCKMRRFKNCQLCNQHFIGHNLSVAQVYKTFKPVKKTPDPLGPVAR